MNRPLRTALLSLHLLQPRWPRGGIPLAVAVSAGLGTLTGCGPSTPAPTPTPTPTPGTTAPVDFKVAVTTADSVTVSWTAYPGATGYVLDRRTASGDFQQVATPAAAATSHVDRGLTAGTTYLYRLRARTAKGDSATTAEVSATPTLGGADTDGDGVADADELAGYDVIIKEAGVQRSTSRVTTDPAKADTDGDGFTDGEERALSSDGSRPDTDADGLSDVEESARWGSTANDVDSDGDAKGNPALFDGQEVKRYGTSPTLKDTDGDKYSDLVEAVERGGVYSPLIANTPRVELAIATAPVIDLNVTVSSGSSETTSRRTSLALATQDQRSVTDSQTHQFTAELSATVGAEVSGGTGGFNASVNASVTATAGYGYEKTAAYTATSVRGAEQVSEDALSEATEKGTQLSGGKLTVGFTIKNAGAVTFRLSNVVIAAYLRDPANPTASTFIGNLRPSVNGLSFEGGRTSGALAADIALSTDVALALMRNPQNVYFQFAAFDVEDDDGRNFAFLNETTSAQTASVVIDYGNGDIVRQRVATNVERRGNELVGVKLSTVLKDILKLPYTTTTVNGVQVLKALRDDGPNFTGDVAAGAADHSVWAVVGLKPLTLSRTTNFDDIVLTPSSEIRLLRVQDMDQDGLLSFEEYQYGTSDTDTDSDDDSLGDYQEARVGWTVTPATTVAGYPKRVYSDPMDDDADGDALTDKQEQARGTDPQNADTDRDTLRDDRDPDPLVTYNAPPTVALTTSVSGYRTTVSGTVKDDKDPVRSLAIAWGDGRTDTLSTGFAGVNVTHDYDTCGTKTVTVTATDARGAVATQTYAVTVTCVPTTGLRAYYPLNGTGEDLGGNRLNGTFSGSVGPTGNRFGEAAGAMAFTDARNTEIPLGSMTATGGLTADPAVKSFTLAAWVYRKDPWPALDGSGSPLTLWIVGEQNWGRLVLNGGRPSLILPVQTSSGLGNTIVQNQDFLLPSGSWVFVAATLSSAGGSTTAQIYVNGESIRTTTFAATVTPVIDRACGWIFIGATPGGGSTCSSSAAASAYDPGLGGSVDDVRIYTRALSADEIKLLYSENRWPR